MEVTEYLKHYNNHGDPVSLNIVQKYNKELCKKYPWLIPRNAWSGKKITDCANGEEGFWPGTPDVKPDYNYEFTELDSMPDGWRIAFGEKMCEDLNNELVKFDYVDKLIIEQIKEKFGGLRFYVGSVPVGKLSDDYEEIVQTDFKYPEYDRDTEYVVLARTDKPVDSNTQEDKYVFHKHKILDKCRIYDIIDEYEKLSYTVCIQCGAKAKYVTTGWICPFCEKCIESQRQFGDKIVPINEYYNLSD